MLTVAIRLLAREVLDYGAKRIDRELVHEPQVQSQLMSTMGRVYQNLGLYAQAEPLFSRSLSSRKALAGDQPNEELAESFLRMGELRHYQHQYDDAKDAYNSALAEFKKLHVQKEHESIALVLDLLGRCYRDQGQYEKAKDLTEQAYSMRKKLFGEEHVTISRSLQSLGMIEYLRQDAAKATPYLEKSLELRKKNIGARASGYS